jgi:hypothetical protein
MHVHALNPALPTRRDHRGRGWPWAWCWWREEGRCRGPRVAAPRELWGGWYWRGPGRGSGRGQRGPGPNACCSKGWPGWAGPGRGGCPTCPHRRPQRQPVPESMTALCSSSGEPTSSLSMPSHVLRSLFDGMNVPRVLLAPHNMNTLGTRYGTPEAAPTIPYLIQLSSHGDLCVPRADGGGDGGTHHHLYRRQEDAVSKRGVAWRGGDLGRSAVRGARVGHSWGWACGEKGRGSRSPTPCPLHVEGVGPRAAWFRPRAGPRHTCNDHGITCHAFAWLALFGGWGS